MKGGHSHPRDSKTPAAIATLLSVHIQLLLCPTPGCYCQDAGLLLLPVSLEGLTYSRVYFADASQNWAFSCIENRSSISQTSDPTHHWCSMRHAGKQPVLGSVILGCFLCETWCIWHALRTPPTSVRIRRGMPTLSILLESKCILRCPTAWHHWDPANESSRPLSGPPDWLLWVQLLHW